MNNKMGIYGASEMKNTIKKISMISVLGLVILLAGCINLEIKQKIDRVGNSNIEIVFDMSKLVEPFKESVSQYCSEVSEEKDSKEGFMKSCDDFNEKTKLKNPKCSVTEDYKIVMSGELALGGETFKVVKSIPYITYTYDAKHIEKLVSESVGGSKNLGIPSEDLGESSDFGNFGLSPEMLGIKATYTLEMPGKIVKADFGEIKDNKLIMDLIELQDKDKALVESQELNLTWLIAGGAVLFMIVIIVLALVLRRK